MEKEKDLTQKKNFDYKWLLLLIGFGLLVYLFYLKKEDTPEIGETTPVEEINNEDISAIERTPEPNYRPQYSAHYPKPKPTDPFSESEDFERMMKSNTNKADFDFSFENQKPIPTYNLKNGKIDFELIGGVRTAVELENKVPLSIEIYNNDQISLTKRKKTYAFDLPFVKETEKKTSRDKVLYSFDFKTSSALDPGLYYFLIVPTGRNRILYVGKFNVK